MKITLVLSTVFLLLGFDIANASTTRDYVLCKNGGVVRSLRVDSDSANSCVVKYTKSGTDEVIGSGSSMNGCSSILGRVRTKLEKHWWRCRSVQKLTFDDRTR